MFAPYQVPPQIGVAARHLDIWIWSQRVVAQQLRGSGKSGGGSARRRAGGDLTNGNEAWDRNTQDRETPGIAFPNSRGLGCSRTLKELSNAVDAP